MRAFAALFECIDQTTSTNEKVEIMAEFFRRQDAETSAWALFFLSGRKPKKLVGSAKLSQWVQEVVGVPDWLMAECYAAVGDTAEMVALMLAAVVHERRTSESTNALPLGEWMKNRLLPLATMDDASRRHRIVDWWQQVPPKEVFILNKLLTGSLRVGVSETLVYRSLALVFSLTPPVIASRLMGNWHPTAEFFLRFGRVDEDDSAVTTDNTWLPLPFCLAAPLDKAAEELGPIGDWYYEWKWDGIRCQVVKRGVHLEIWSRGEERITGSFPDLAGCRFRSSAKPGMPFLRPIWCDGGCDRQRKDLCGSRWSTHRSDHSSPVRRRTVIDPLHQPIESSRARRHSGDSESADQPWMAAGHCRPNGRHRAVGSSSTEERVAAYIGDDAGIAGHSYDRSRMARSHEGAASGGSG